MNHTDSPCPRARRWGASLLVFAALSTLPAVFAAGPVVLPNSSSYFPGEDILVDFSGGPGNPKDWIGVYPVDVVPDGSVGSTIWRYVDGTQDGTVGLTEGKITFPAGLGLAGDWSVYLLLNDGYTVLASNRVSVVDPSTPGIRLPQRVYTTGQRIDVTFTNGPANPKDWIGVYHAGETPGPVPATVWFYVDGTQNGNTGLANGTISFATGLDQPGDYLVHFLLNDGYDILATETFTVVAAAPSAPRVLSLSPANGSSNQPPQLAFSATITNSTSKVVTNTITLQLDGSPVTPEITGAGESVSVRFTSAILPAAGSEHTWVMTFSDNATPPAEIRTETRTTIGAYTNIVTNSPLVFENFDTIPEGSLPAGWTEKGYSTPINEAIDFGDLGSAAYRTWTAVNADRFRGPLIPYGNPDDPPGGTTDYQRVLSINLFNVVNGKVLNEPLAQGRFLFGNSGYQNGSASQVVYLQTPDFDLSGKTNVHLGFKSLWEQNQDSVAAIEYSIDGGQTWMPIAYFLDNPDIVRLEDGTIDAEATFNQEQGDVARYTDDTGNEIGGTYGAFIAAPISPALAPFIQERVNDDPVESKRFEWYRVAQGDNQTRVRFRFAHAGTDSWYFGIDDFGLYAPSDSGPAPSLAIRRDGADVVISWPDTAAGYVLESSTVVKPASWQAVPGVTGNTYRTTPASLTGFFRLAK